MGAFYGSVQVRSQDRDQIKTVAEKIAMKMEIQVLIGPALNGWVGLYPEGHGQNESVGKEFAEQVAFDVLHVLVHDDDIFAYWYYCEGKLIDSYWSKPGYFGDEDQAVQEQMSGEPEVFRPMIGDKVKRLKTLLQREGEEPVFETERLISFARLLKIPNAATSYEDLKAGERDGIKGWRQFEEVRMSIVKEGMAKKKREKDLVRIEQKRFKREGLLLLIDEHRRETPHGCMFGEGFVVAWSDNHKNTVAFDQYHEPWDKPNPLSLETPVHITAIDSDKEGWRIAMTGIDRVRVWEVESGNWNHLADILESDLAIGVSVSSDGKHVFHASREMLYMTELQSGQKIFSLPAIGARKGAIHPSEKWVAVACGKLRLFPIRKDPPWIELEVRREMKFDSSQQELFKSKLASQDMNELRRLHRVITDREMDVVRRRNSQLRTDKLSDEQIDAIQLGKEKGNEGKISHLIAMQEGRLPPMPFIPEQTNYVGFSRDGKWLWCETVACLRIFEWANVPREAGSVMPLPRWSFSASGSIYAITDEVDSLAIVFGGSEGILYRMDLTNGQVQKLLELPGKESVGSLVMSKNGNALGVACSGRTRCTWYVFSYPKLRSSSIHV